MIHSQSSQVIEVIEPASISAGATTAGEIDCLGFTSAIVILNCGAMQGAMTTCSLTEGDVTGSATDAIDELTVGNAKCVDVEGTAIALAATNTSDCIVFHVNLAKRKRFLKLNTVSASGGASVFGATAILFGPDVQLNTNAAMATASTGTALVTNV